MGGGGVVYAAYDEVLERPVAIKVLWSVGYDPRALAREARVVAELSHPNIVTVYDIGVARDRSFVVMELVDGGSMRRWLEQTKPRPQRVVAMLMSVARGLAHAHRMGIVHRDFKLDNVLVSRDGRALVTDFGLATRAGVAGEHHGVGTLPYMAPEQHRGEPAGPAADQFSLCVALFHALHGVAPFAGRSADELHLAKRTGVIATVPRRGAPRHVQRAILRGLSPRPADRFASIEQLITAIERRRHRGWIVGMVATVAIASVGLGLTPDDDPCDTIPAPWSARDTARVRRALDTSGTHFGASTGARVHRMLSRYATEWTEDRARVCENTANTPAQREPALEAIDGCLRRAKLRLAALATILDEAGPSMAEHAIQVAESLLPPRECWRYPEPSLALPQQVRIELESKLALAQAYGVAGLFAASDELAQETALLAQRTEAPAFAARARLIRGRAAVELAHHSEGREALEEAYYGATSLGDDDTALDAAVELLQLSSRQRPDGPSAQRWDEIAQAQLVRSPPDADGQAAVLHARAEYAIETGDPDAWVELHRQALALRRRNDDPSLPLADSLEGLGRAEFHTGHTDRALGLFCEALELRSVLLGARHPWLAVAHNNYGVALAIADQQQPAQEHLQLGLQILQASLGPDHPRVGRASSNLGRFALVRGEWGIARDHLERAASILETALGPRHRETVATYLALIGARRGDGALEASLSLALRVVADAEREEGTRTDPAPIYRELGDSYGALGRHQEALTAYKQALTWIDELGSEKDLRPHVVYEVASTLECLGQQARALALAEEVWPKVWPGRLQSRLAVLRARLEAQRGHHEQALTLARMALEQLPAWAQADHARVRRIETMVERLSAGPWEPPAPNRCRAATAPPP